MSHVHEVVKEYLSDALLLVDELRSQLEDTKGHINEDTLIGVTADAMRELTNGPIQSKLDSVEQLFRETIADIQTKLAEEESNDETE